MKITRTGLKVIEVLFICLMSLSGTLSFYFSNAYDLLQRTINNHFPLFNTYLIAICCGILLLIAGLLTVTLKRKGGGIFTWLVILFYAPSLLSYSSADLLQVLRLKQSLATGLSFYTTLCIGLFIIIGFFLLNFMSLYKQTYQHLIARNADLEDIKAINANSHSLLFLITAAGLIAVMIVATIAYFSKSLWLSLITKLPLNAVWVGLGVILIMALYVYWVGSRRNSRLEEE